MFLEDETSTKLQPGDAAEWDRRSHSVSFWRYTSTGPKRICCLKDTKRYQIDHIKNLSALVCVLELIAATHHLGVRRIELMQYTFIFIPLS